MNKHKESWSEPSMHPNQGNVLLFTFALFFLLLYFKERGREREERRVYIYREIEWEFSVVPIQRDFHPFLNCKHEISHLLESLIINKYCYYTFLCCRKLVK